MTEQDEPVEDAPASASQAARSDASEPGEPRRIHVSLDDDPSKSLAETLSELRATTELSPSLQDSIKRMSEATAKLSSSELFAEAQRQQQELWASVAASVRESHERPIYSAIKFADPQLAALDYQSELLQAIELHQARTADQAALEADLGRQQDRFTRRVSWAALGLAIVSIVVGIIGVIVQAWATLSTQ